MSKQLGHFEFKEAQRRFKFIEKVLKDTVRARREHGYSQRQQREIARIRREIVHQQLEETWKKQELEAAKPSSMFLEMAERKGQEAEMVKGNREQKVWGIEHRTPPGRPNCCDQNVYNCDRKTKEKTTQNAPQHKVYDVNGENKKTKMKNKQETDHNQQQPHPIVNTVYSGSIRNIKYDSRYDFGNPTIGQTMRFPSGYLRPSKNRKHVNQEKYM